MGAMVVEVPIHKIYRFLESESRPIRLRVVFDCCWGGSPPWVYHSLPSPWVTTMTTAFRYGAPVLLLHSIRERTSIVLAGEGRGVSDTSPNFDRSLAPNAVCTVSSRVNAINVGWTLTDNEHTIQREEMGSDNWLEEADKV